MPQTLPNASRQKCLESQFWSLAYFVYKQLCADQRELRSEPPSLDGWLGESTERGWVELPRQGLGIVKETVVTTKTWCLSRPYLTPSPSLMVAQLETCKFTKHTGSSFICHK